MLAANRRFGLASRASWPRGERTAVAAVGEADADPIAAGVGVAAAVELAAKVAAKNRGKRAIAISRRRQPGSEGGVTRTRRATRFKDIRTSA
ncbi:hypothetical protein GCM10019060_35030 [Novosphingobium pokkalii]|nr:hypothetical protein GCM10019060_35030 [Novosphingobium pokkalii]